MSLIPCPECKISVSERARSCPQCGCPIAREVLPPWKGDSQVVTTQQTAKKYKGLILGGTLAFIIGGFMWMATLESGGARNELFGWISVGGFAIQLCARIEAWWHHG